MGRWTRNADVVERLSSDFQENYENTFAWESACSQYLALPCLRGFWPMSSISDTQAQDLSGQGRHLTWNGTSPNFSQEVLIPYLDATDHAAPFFPDYLSRPDEAGLDIIGNEPYIANPSQGVTMGAWIRFDSVAPLNADMIISKGIFTLAGNTSYGLYRRSAAAGGLLRASFSDGAAFENVDSVAAPGAGVWYFTAGKWGPNNAGVGANESACFLNGVKATSGPTALLALNNTGSPLQVMGRDDGAGGSLENTHGRISMVFLCAAALRDGVIFSLYERSRALFGV